MEIQQAVASFRVEGDDNITGESSNVEHCVLEWIIKDFLDESRRGAELKFSASNNGESSTLWQLGLSVEDQQNGIQINLTRLVSQNHALVLVRLRWEIQDANGNKVFPGSIHALVYQTDKSSKKFIDTGKLLEDAPRFLPDGSLHICFELTAYDRTVEERISSLIKGNIRYTLHGLTEDMEKVFLTESGADMRISSVDGTMSCHRSILSARSRVFARLIQEVRSDDCHLHLGEFKGDVLLAVLTYLYVGTLDLYLKHTIPRDLYSIATEYDLKPLQQHLNFVNGNGVTTIRTLNVTWKIPNFKKLILKPKVALYCPEPNASTYYDKRWCFKLEFDSSSEGVDISVVRRQHDNANHYVKFVVQVQKNRHTLFGDTKFLQFNADGAQGMEAFMTKEELSEYLSFEDTLVLRCSLDIFKGIHRSSRQRESRLKTLVAQISKHVEVSLLKLAEDLRRMYACDMFSDAVVKTKVGKIAYHSYMANARFDLQDWCFKAFVESLDPQIVKDFFLFLYEGVVSKNKAIGIKQAAEQRCVDSIIEKMKDFLVFHKG